MASSQGCLIKSLAIFLSYLFVAFNPAGIKAAYVLEGNSLSLLHENTIIIS